MPYARNGSPSLGVGAATSVANEATVVGQENERQLAGRFDDVELRTGVRLRYLEQGHPAGHPIIFLHGYSDSSFSYSRILPLLPDRYHAYALDLRGHGDSERPASGYAMRELATDVIAFMDARQVREATVVGHSLGSFIAQEVTLAAPERVARLVLIGSGTSIHRVQGIGELEAATDALEDPVPLEFVSAFQASTVYRELPAEFMDQVNQESLKLPARVWRSVMSGMLATGPAVELGDLGIPTRILWGDRDAIFPREEQDLLLGMIPHAVLTVFAETGHAPHWERPSEVARELRAFIDSTT